MPTQSFLVASERNDMSILTFLVFPVASLNWEEETEKEEEEKEGSGRCDATIPLLSMLCCFSFERNGRPENIQASIAFCSNT